jgi:cell wall-associated NlpC family hydrolase
MPVATRRRSCRPQLEAFEKRDVPTMGLTGQVVWAAVPLAQGAQVKAYSLAALGTSDPFLRTAEIDQSSLRPGDILVSTEKGFVSNAIRTSTFSAYSHASIYVGDGKIIDATGDGVQRRNLSALTKPAARVGVIRVDSLTSSQQDQVVATARKLVGKSYNYFGLIFGGVVELTPIYRAYRTVTGKPLKVSGSTLGFGYFCSELVIKSYKSAGITIAPDAGDTPGGIINYALEHGQQFQLIGRLPVGKS